MGWRKSWCAKAGFSSSASADEQWTHLFTGEFTLITPGVWTLTTADLANGLSCAVMVTVDT
jgi:hypothetical protein